ncbi:MAG: DinB family protein [Candidatus Methylomirabilales bacterium]
MEALQMNPGHGSPFVIQDLPGFTPQISRLVVMMNYARLTTVAAVQNLTTSQLDYLHDARSNTIGALLGHIAAVEGAYQVDTFDGRGLNEEEKKQWSTFLELGEKARREIRGHPLDYYLRLLKDVRQKTLSEFAGRTDNWLYEQTLFWGNQPVNNYFKWFHVLEDEINHRGQIRWLCKRLPG